MTSAGTAGRPALPGNATYFDGEIPCRSTRRLPRFVDEFVMGQIEAEANLARLPDLSIQTAIVLLTETGLRSIDALRLSQGRLEASRGLCRASTTVTLDPGLLP